LEIGVNKFFYAPLLMVSAALTACGGGGADAPIVPSTQKEPAPVLSETQRLFEEAALTSNGGVYSLGISTISSGATITATFAQFTKIDLAKSPLGIAEGVTATISVGNDLISTLPTAANQSESNPNIGTTFVDNGQLYFHAASAPSKYTYSGDNIIVDTSAPTGQSGFKILVTGYKKVTLTGTLASAPIEFINLTKSIASYTDSSKSFLSGAAYYQRVAKRVGDHLFINDADRNPATDPKSATPLYTGTIEQYAVSAPAELVLTKGAVKTVKGARCWVNSVAGASNGTIAIQFSASTLPQFGAVCEISDKVYGASLQPDGAEMGSIYSTGLASPSSERYAFQPRFNKAAFDSIKAALP
jgi:hypothetical protein